MMQKCSGIERRANPLARVDVEKKDTYISSITRIRTLTTSRQINRETSLRFSFVRSDRGRSHARDNRSPESMGASRGGGGSIDSAGRDDSRAGFAYWPLSKSRLAA